MLKTRPNQISTCPRQSDIGLVAACVDALFAIIGSLRNHERRRQQERHKFVYLTVKNNRFARAFFIFGHSADVLVLSTT